MTTLTEAAEAAYLKHIADAEAAIEAERKALRQAAVEAVRSVLVRPDGTGMTLTEAGLKPVYTVVEQGMVVYSDGAVSLAAIRREDRWPVFLVELVDGQWTRRSDRIRTLAELGAALDAAVGA